MNLGWHRLFLWFLIIGLQSWVLSQFILCSFGFSSLQHYCSFYWSLIVCSFGFSSLEHHPMFFVILFFGHLGYHPRFYLYLIIFLFGFSLSLEHHTRFYLNFFFIPLVSHHWHTILCSISVYSLIIWFLVIGIPS